MSNFDHSLMDELLRFEVQLDLRAFVRAAVRQNLKRPAILVYLYFVADTPEATEKMKRFFPVAQENDLSRNEILIWLHIASGGSANPKQISRQLRIPSRWAKKALTVLEEKHIVIDGRSI